ncbi:hypothetical protein J6590_025209 [Homalodisca vitripennis]|nr:hypothetical protein J6590_025209 [Homalodisca vitripennis]
MKRSCFIKLSPSESSSLVARDDSLERISSNLEYMGSIVTLLQSVLLHSHLILLSTRINQQPLNPPTDMRARSNTGDD